MKILAATDSSISLDISSGVYSQGVELSNVDAISEPALKRVYISLTYSGKTGEKNIRVGGTSRWKGRREKKIKSTFTCQTHVETVTEQDE